MTSPVSSESPRESGKRRIDAATRWTLAGALAATGMFAGFVSARHNSAAATGTESGVAPTAPTQPQSSSNDDSQNARSPWSDRGFSSPQDNANGSNDTPQQLQPTPVQPPASGGASATSGAS